MSQYPTPTWISRALQGVGIQIAPFYNNRRMLITRSSVFMFSIRHNYAAGQKGAALDIEINGTKEVTFCTKKEIRAICAGHDKEEILVKILAEVAIHKALEESDGT